MSTNTQTTSALLLYQVGPVHCCAPSQAVRAVIEPPPFTRTPGSSERRPGIFRYNRQIIPVTDLRVGFGVEPQQRQKPGRLIIVDFGDRATGFWVDGIHNVVAWPGEGWGPLPALLPRGIFTRTLQLDDRIHLYAEFAQLDRLQTDGYLRDYIHHLEQQGQEDAAARRPQSTSSTASKSGATSGIVVGSPAGTPSGIPAQPRPAATKPLSLTPSRMVSNDAEPDRGVPQRETLTNASMDAHAAAPKTAGRHEPDLLPSRRTGSGSDPASGTSRTNSRAAAERDQVGGFHRTVPWSGATGPSSRPVSTPPEPGSEAGAKPASKPRRSPTFHSPPIAPAVVTGSEVVSETAPTPTQARSQTPQRKNELPNSVRSSPNREGAPSVTSHPAPGELARRRHTESDDTGNPVLPLLLLLALIAGVGAGIWYGLAPDRTAPRQDPAPLASKPTPEPDTPPSTAASRDRDPAEFSIDQRSTEGKIGDAMGSDALTGTENTGGDNRGNHWADSPQDDGTTHVGGETESEGESETESTAHANLEDDVGPGPTPPPTVPAHGEDIASAKTESPAEPPLPHSVGAPQDPYEAEIRRDQTGITIVLTTPQDSAVFKDVPKQPAETDQAESASATARLPENLPDKPAEESTDHPVEDQADQPIILPPTDVVVLQQRVTREIVHLVVKGDTLWHIAQRYVNDPFRYPELARLSNIRNPDLIYPGDRVRIIHTVKAPSAEAGGP